jgi:phage terminase large subunit GpA-like protein
LSISEWADRERRLSPEISAEPGRWRTSRAEYLRGIMDCISDPGVETVVVMKSAQVGMTECLGNVCGYYMDQDPAPILVIQPTLEVAEAWSKDRLATMIRDTPCLTGKVRDPRSRDSGNTLRHKEYSGGRLTIIGANSPVGLRSRSIRVVLADEVDAYPPSAGTEGDPLTLAAVRQQTFWNRKTVIASTPLHKVTSTVFRLWSQSDQRRYYVPCPHCDHQQVLVWHQVRWDKSDAGAHQPDTACYVCEECGALWTDVERWSAISRGRWQIEAPAMPIVGFHVSGLMSPWLRLEDIVRKFLVAKGDAYLMQTWSNTVLGEPFEEERESVAASGLIARCEPYGPESVPDACRILVGGCDVQDNRLEISVWGFGARNESWLITHEILHGDPALPQLWDELDQFLRLQFTRQDGNLMRIMACCVDSGGHHAASVFGFCRAHHRRRIFPTKGVAGSRPIWNARPSRAGYKGADRVYLIGVDTAKDAIYSRLRIDKPGAGFVHFPTLDIVDERYFDQLVAEHVVTRKREGRSYRQWVLPGNKLNEALDCAVLALGALRATNYRLDAEPAAQPAPSPPLESEPRRPWIDLTAWRESWERG